MLNKTAETLLLVAAICGVALGAQAQSVVRRYDDSVLRRIYLHVPGQFTQAQAWEEARRRGGHPVVFSSETEWRRVLGFFDYRTIAPCHTGHYQLPTGREPGMGWVTVTGERGYWNWNGTGPDDGVRNKWGWNSVEGGIEVFYGPSNGKNEDAAVIWHDNQGKFEDVSVNHRGGVLVEIRR